MGVRERPSNQKFVGIRWASRISKIRKIIKLWLSSPANQMVRVYPKSDRVFGRAWTTVRMRYIICGRPTRIGQNFELSLMELERIHYVNDPKRQMKSRLVESLLDIMSIHRSWRIGLQYGNPINLKVAKTDIYIFEVQICHWKWKMFLSSLTPSTNSVPRIPDSQKFHKNFAKFPTFLVEFRVISWFCRHLKGSIRRQIPWWYRKQGD